MPRPRAPPRRHPRLARRHLRLADDLAARRRARVEQLHRVSWRVGQVAHWRHPVARWLRDLAMRATPMSALARSADKVFAPGFALAEQLRAASVP